MESGLQEPPVGPLANAETERVKARKSVEIFFIEVVFQEESNLSILGLGTVLCIFYERKQ